MTHARRQRGGAPHGLTCGRLAVLRRAFSSSLRPGGSRFFDAGRSDGFVGPRGDAGKAVRWCDTFAATGAGTLKGKRRLEDLAQRWQTTRRRAD